MSPLTRLDGRPTRLAADEILAVSCIRDEVLRLPSFLRHHRELGVGRFFVVDNDSSDGSLELLLEQPDVHLFETKASYSASHCGTDWINELLARFGVGHWTLTLDADEHFIYPDFEQLDLRGLVGYLAGHGSQAMVSLLLDMYSAEPIAETTYDPRERLLDRCPYFDSDSYFEPWPRFQNLPVRGGPRARSFTYEGGRKGPLLGKFPLAHWFPGLAYPGHTHDLAHRGASDVTGILLHFKFLSDFPARVETVVATGEQWNNATEYRSYAQGLRDAPNLSLAYSGSVRFRSSRQLVDLGLARSSPAFSSYVEGVVGAG